VADQAEPARLTIRDVARAAGVSYQTVSRALNDAPGIDAATRRRVLAVADGLGYRPSRLARSLVTRRTETIGLAVTAITNPFYAHVTQAVLEAAETAGLRVMVAPTRWSEADEETALETLVDHGVDGIVGFLDHVAEERLEQVARRLPLVLVNRWTPPPAIPTLNVDLAGGARQALEHLLGLGHERIGMLDGTPAWNDGDRRHTTYLALARERGLPVDAGWIEREPDSAAGGRRATEALLARQPTLTALFAFNDLMAAGALDALRRAGRRVPDDCAVVGFDGTPLAELTSPPLSTVAIRYEELGQRALDLIGRWQAGGRGAAAGPDGLVATWLVPRESTVGAASLRS
jgi:LacI family transcriptional regulator